MIHSLQDNKEAQKAVRWALTSAKAAKTHFLPTRTLLLVPHTKHTAYETPTIHPWVQVLDTIPAGAPIICEPSIWTGGEITSTISRTKGHQLLLIANLGRPGPDTPFPKHGMRLCTACIPPTKASNPSPTLPSALPTSPSPPYPRLSESSYRSTGPLECSRVLGSPKVKPMYVFFSISHVKMDSSHWVWLAVGPFYK